jgi:integrase-like protein
MLTVEDLTEPPLTLGVYLGRWLAHVKGRVRPKTHDGYEGMLRLYVLPCLGPALLAELRPLDLYGLYGDLLARGLSGGTVLNLHLALTNALAQAARWGLIPSNPAAGAQPPRLVSALALVVAFLGLPAVAATPHRSRAQDNAGANRPANPRVPSPSASTTIASAVNGSLDPATAPAGRG